MFSRKLEIPVQTGSRIPRLDQLLRPLRNKFRLAPTRRRSCNTGMISILCASGLQSVGEVQFETTRVDHDSREVGASTKDVRDRLA